MFKKCFAHIFEDGCTFLTLTLLLTGEVHVEHLGCHAVYPSVLDFWTGRMG